MEIPDIGQSDVFTKSEKFEINEYEFRHIRVDRHRISAQGKSWTRFEILVSFIGAAWMEKWRRFGMKLLGVSILLIALGSTMALVNPMMMFLSMIPGIILILLWLFVKRESLILFTPGGMFKIEGSASFVESLWAKIAQLQREKDQ
jgi:hypothetical protein